MTRTIEYPRSLHPIVINRDFLGLSPLQIAICRKRAFKEMDPENRSPLQSRPSHEEPIKTAIVKMARKMKYIPEMETKEI